MERCSGPRTPLAVRDPERDPPTGRFTVPTDDGTLAPTALDDVLPPAARRGR